MKALILPVALMALSLSASAQMTIPSGTDIRVRTNESIDSKNADLNRVYSAQVDRDVTDTNGNVVIPRGSNADLVVRKIDNNNLALDLQSVTVNGQRYAVAAAEQNRSGSSNRGVGKNRRTAEMVGGGAALGSILGAIAGGGHGAALGAVLGAGAGAGVQVLTKGKEVKVPAETVLTFPLQSSLQLNPMR